VPENKAVVPSSEGFVLMRLGGVVGSFDGAQAAPHLISIHCGFKERRSRATECGGGATVQAELLYNMMVMGVLSIVGLWVCKMFKKKLRANERAVDGWM
jgi:hypothetical protein